MIFSPSLENLTQETLLVCPWNTVYSYALELVYLHNLIRVSSEQVTTKF